MSSGTLFLVVGPSGAGKDTLIDGARAVFAGHDTIVFASRAITRPADAGGEAHEAMTEEEFDLRHKAGGFLLDWQAHGLKYGVPASYADDLAAGRNVIANVSRSVIAEALSRFPKVVVLEVTASPQILADRLAGRGRETAEEIAARLAREAATVPEDAVKATIVNDGTPEAGIAAFVAALKGEAPHSPMLLARKISGGALDREGYRAVIGDIVAGRFTDQETADFLVAVTESLADDETVALTRARADFAEKIRWDSDLVVDKHSMGGIPGNRISLIVIPIVATYGLTIPKTSSRAITSPAGTADTMEVLARVDLDPEQVQRVVRETGGCIAWNGRLNHSRVDEVMNAITRPRKLDSLDWSVSSILSKKLAAGATHCIIDVPVGRTAKVPSAADGERLRDRFLYVGDRLGLTLGVRLSDGSAPIGRGIGPALEARDVVAVLRNDPGAPADLRNKALDFAASILRFDPAMSDADVHAKVRGLLDSGAPLETFERICALQGPPPETAEIGSYTAEIKAVAYGTVGEIDCFALAGIARAAGAPADKGAGIDLLAGVGASVSRDDAIYRIHARDENALEAAVARAAENHAFRIDPS
ncbi:MAG: phosphonate metabolism protein/1,5-bisphosphokinase (PRPP-forming) PhnN [Alphaproteobacteria bacterium]